MKKQLLFLMTTIFGMNIFSQTPPAYIPTNGLISWYPFNGNANDESGNGNNGTPMNGVSLTNDRFNSANSAYSFDGVDDYIISNSATGYLSDSISINFWVNYNTDFGYGDMIDFGDASSVRWGGECGATMLRASVGRGCSGTGNILTYNTSAGWHMVTYIIKGTDQDIYYDGILVGSETNSLPSSLGCATTSLWFGVDIFSIAEYYNGKLDDIAIWDRALTPSEVTQVNQGSGALSSQFCFDPGNYYPVGTNPLSIASGDFDGDGDKDLVTSNNGSNDISVLLGNGTGSFGSATTYTLTSSPAEIIVNHFNNDTILDLAIAGGGNNVWIMLGVGNGTFNSATSFSATLFPTSLCAGDFNGDLKLDLAVGNGNSANSISILLGDGLGGFGSPTNFSVGTCPCGSSCIKTADFNADTKLDIVVANQNSDNVSLLLGDGLGNFGSATNFSVGTYPWAIVVADFNGDTFKDCVTSNQNSNNVSVLLGNGAGSFATATNFSVGTKPEMVIYSDFDGDSNFDIATADRNSNTISILPGDGTGSFGTVSTFSVVNGPFALCKNDFNGDSKMDIATANFISNDVAVLLNCNTLGVEEIKKQNQSVVYPNPTTDFISIKSNNKISGQKYFITDSFGRQILSGQFSNENSGIDLSSLATGIYFLQINGQQEKSVKIFKN